MSQRQPRGILIILMLAALGVFLPGINWGLPSRSVDPFLFGNHPIWSGERIAQLAGERDNANLGADVQRNAAARGSILNQTDEQRAQIARRYRLFTYQPDEMITMMSLASMKRGDFDPKLYQYGGLWIYPVGAMLKAASILKLITLTSSQAFYLDHPDAFGKFYIVARLYTVLWGLLGVWAIFHFTKSAAATAMFIVLPVVVNMAHEAKPHLPGAVLIILAVMAAGKFVESGRRRWWILCGALCGAAAGMIVSGFVAFAILPVMVWMRGKKIGILLAAAGVGVGVYFLTNPYVLVHLLRDPSVLASNLGNSTAMYHAGFGAFNAMRLIAEGTTGIVAIVGIVGILVVSAKPQAAEWRALLVVVILVMVQFVALAAGKPGEYGRFAILPDVMLAIAAVGMIQASRIRGFEKVEAIGLLLIFTAMSSAIYLHGFLRDSSATTRRIEEASALANLQRRGAMTLGIYDEPAPYLLPAVDLFEWKILLLPREFEMAAGRAPVDVIVRAVDRMSPQATVSGDYVQVSRRTFDDLFPAQISWANKPIEIWVRRELLPASG